MNTQFKYISDVMENQDGQDENTKMSNTDEASRWYAAHILLYSEFLDGIQDYYNVWENIYLISARSVDEAYSKADEIGQLEEKADKDSGHTCDDRPARWLFAGVRRLAECIDV